MLCRNTLYSLVIQSHSDYTKKEDIRQLDFGSQLLSTEGVKQRQNNAVETRYSISRLHLLLLFLHVIAETVTASEQGTAEQ